MKIQGHLHGALVVCVLLVGCSVGPAYQRPAVEAPAVWGEAYRWQPAQPRDDAARGEWWKAFDDPQLDQLIAQVGVSNQTLVAAEAQFRQGVALSDAAGAALYPTVTASISQTRSLPSGTTGPITGVATSKRTISSLPLSASWQPDFWGQVRSSVEAGRAAAQASAGDLENARLSIRAQVALAYFQLRGIDAQKKLLDETVEAYAKSLQLTGNRYRMGVAARIDMSQAEAQLKAVQAQRIDLGVQRSQFEHAIAVLLGRPPAGFSIAAAPLTATPPPVPVGLPADLLERRPDIAAAERRVAAANAQIGVAKAAWFPTATLNATYGFQTATAAKWFTLPSRFWSVGPALAETLFDGGKRQAASDQAVAAYDASVANYRQSVLVAFQQVEDGLASLRILEEEAEVQADAVKAARQSLEFALNQYKAGITTYLQVLSAQTTLLSIQNGAASVRTRRATAWVQLVQALGGGWDASALPQAEDLHRKAGTSAGR